MSWLTITVHQEADVAYQSSTPQARVEVEVDTGDMVQFRNPSKPWQQVEYAAPPMVGITPWIRACTRKQHQSIESTGYMGTLPVTIEGGSVDIFCCSE